MPSVASPSCDPACGSARRLAPVAAFHDGTVLTALVADEDGAWIERRTGADPEALARELLDAVS